MPSLRAWGQGIGAPAHLQLVQRPLGQSTSQGNHTLISKLVLVKQQFGQGVAKRQHMAQLHHLIITPIEISVRQLSNVTKE